MSDKYTSILKKMWIDIYDLNQQIDTVADTYLHKEYSQCINGTEMDRNEYLHHVTEQKNNIRMQHIDYKYVCEQDAEVFALYYPEGINQELLPIKAEVIAYFKFKDELLFRVHGQVRLISGKYTDVDMN